MNGTDFPLQCELHETKPFYKLDDEVQTLIRQRHPKLQSEKRLSVLGQRDEGQPLSALQSYRAVRMSMDAGVRRPMSTIVELSPDQALTSVENLHFARDLPRPSLTPLAQGEHAFPSSPFGLRSRTPGTLTNVFSTVVAMSKKSRPNVVISHENQRNAPTSPTSPERIQYPFVPSCVETVTRRFLV